MATISTRTETVVTLNLSDKEAKVLGAIMGYIGGTGEGREVVAGVAAALDSLGYNSDDYGLTYNCPFVPQGRDLLFRDNFTL
jgi:hypothetical protein